MQSDVLSCANTDQAFRIKVLESNDACGSPNLTIGDSPLPKSGEGQISLGEGIHCHSFWRAMCDGSEQKVILSLDSISTGFLHVELVVRFQQVTPLYISDVQELTPVMIGSALPHSNERLIHDLGNDLQELMFLRNMELELLRGIELKKSILRLAAADGRGDRMLPDQSDVDNIPTTRCSGIWCSFKRKFEIITGLLLPLRPIGEHCGRHYGNQSHDNHTFLHPPWWKHPRGNHTHGNLTHHPCWRPHHPHGNHTHGSHTHPPFHLRPPFFCRPYSRPPHRKPPHHGPNHPGHILPLKRPTFGHLRIQQPFPPSSAPAFHGGVFYAEQASPIFSGLSLLPKLGLIVSLLALAVVLFKGRRRARYGHLSWEEWREARQHTCRAKRAALRRRWIALLDRMRPEEDDGEEAGKIRMLEAGMIVVDENNLVEVEETEVWSEKHEEVDEERMTIAQELASFRDAAHLVEELVAAEKDRGMTRE